MNAPAEKKITGRLIFVASELEAAAKLPMGRPMPIHAFAEDDEKTIELTAVRVDAATIAFLPPKEFRS